MVEIFDDIRKIYKFTAPCGELADCIEFFSESSPGDTARFITTEQFNVKMFPSWTPTIWINLGTPYRLELGNVHHMINPENDILIVRDATATRHNLSGDHIFTVKFFPGGLEAIFGINQSRLINKVVDVNSIIPGVIMQKIKKPLPFEKRMMLLQDYFLQCYKKQKRKDHYLQFVQNTIDNYQSENLQLNTTQMAEKMFVTSKTINRYFNNVVGISPKKYFSILRARTALTEYVADKKNFVPADYGYYDMSHFYKESVKFTGERMTKFPF